METNLIQLKELFHLEDQDLRSYSPLTLAYIGDGVYELIIRTILVKKGNCPVNRLHKKASSLVKAGAQSAIMEVIEEELTPDDMSETNGLNEENLSSLKGMLHQVFHLEDKDLRTYSPLTLAYIGDGVYELVIRTILVKKGNCPVNQLHRKASSLVKAGTQSSMMEVIEPMLTEEEHSVYRRGRNAHSPTMAKHATMADYRRATGFEALMGYLYLKDDFSRIIDLVRAGIGEDKI